MQNSKIFFSVIIVLAVIAGGVYWFLNRPIDLSNDIGPGPARVTEGKVEDLVSFSVKPNDKISGVLAYNGSIKGGWFFEGNIQINILAFDTDKTLIKADHATATSDWQTAEPVEFSGTIDLTGLPTGPAYFEIHNDNASGLSEYDKSILIPIVIE